MANRAAQIGDGDSIQDWFRSIPPVSKFLVVGTFACGCMTSFNLFPSSWGGPSVLLFDYNMIVNKFHFWRLATNFLFAGSFSINFVIHLMILYQNCTAYENDAFNTGAGGSSADFLYMLLLGCGFLNLLAAFDKHLGLGLEIMSEVLLYQILYVTCRKTPEKIMNIYGIFKIKALYLPWVYMGIRMLMGGSITHMFLGVVVGHLYYFLVDEVPHRYGHDLIKTPQFCIRFIEWVTGYTNPVNVGMGIPPNSNAQQAGYGGGRVGGQGTGFPAPGQPQTGVRQRQVGGQGGAFGGGYQWGRGQVLGGD